MNELEQLLRDTLVAREQDAPDGRRLLGDVRARTTRQQHRGWPAVGLVAAATVTVIVVAVQVPGVGDETRRPLAAQSSAPTSTASSSTATGPDPAAVSVGGDPADIIGEWRVTGANETEPTTLTFHEDRVTIQRSCGSQDGSWRASPSGLFVASTASWHPECEGGETAPSWLTAADSFAFDGRNVLLLGRDGSRTALLLPVETETAALDDPSPTTSHGGEGTKPGIFGDSVPVTLEPASPERLIGRWVPLEDAPPGQALNRPFVQFMTNNTWTGSDGCNSQAGRWTATDAGELLGTQGGQTLIACEGLRPIGQWVATAVAAGFDDEVLVLLNGDGREVVRLQRA